MSDVDDYIARFPTDVQPILRGLRQAIRAASPGGDERIRYGMPAIRLDGGCWLHFAGWKNHAGIYPVPGGDEEFEAAIAEYRSAKDTVNLLYSKPMPYELVTRIAEHAARHAAEHERPEHERPEHATPARG
ncbi:iron chaperone [Microcella alkalica]|uniref:Uncharacterized protein YdhG (YjbR/CyaY superfamily) n=1 Tax=Microcella alkalica TaxID=355930 RepID=A0A839EA20_9MICO|nr:DUF1801 domain-containing protein [Microcella alkalica]MBA8848013.1 uncharacterized protein YdhG (YjbR/CyaY superfamily) [Microcella alkalica]